MVGKPFRMPLYGQNGETYVGQSLNYVIARAADRDKPFAGTVYGLMVGGVHKSAVSVELIEEITASQIAVIHIVKLIVTSPFVDVGGVDVLCDVAAEMDVDELKPFADAKHGLFLCHKTGEKLKLQNVKLGVHVSGAVICLAKKGRGNVAAAGEEQVGGLICGIGMKRGVAGDTQPVQRFFIVFCIFTAACNDHGGEKGHALTPFCDEETLLYFMQKLKIGLKNWLSYLSKKVKITVALWGKIQYTFRYN